VCVTTLYVARLTLVYSLRGLVAGLTGSLFGAISSNPWAYFLMGNLLLVFAWQILGVCSMDVPAALRAWAARLGPASPSSAFLMGAVSGLVAAPCGAPAF